MVIANPWVQELYRAMTLARGRSRITQRPSPAQTLRIPLPVGRDAFVMGLMPASGASRLKPLPQVLSARISGQSELAALQWRGTAWLRRWCRHVDRPHGTLVEVRP